ncbi:MAG: putative rane protein, partial [Myxococcaceae bacterium]|nr:putative rane protein [Myxococcaceae bacterium]
ADERCESSRGGVDASRDIEQNSGVFDRELVAMHHEASVMLVAAGVIHLLPLVGVLGSDRLATRHGIACNEQNPAILLRHRQLTKDFAAPPEP